MGERVLVLSYDSRWLPYRDSVREANLAVCRARSWTLRLVHDHLPVVHPWWIKLFLVRQALAGPWDFVWWLDSDAWFAPQPYDHRDLFHRGIELILSRTPPECFQGVCTGVFCVRNSATGKRILDAWLEGWDREICRQWELREGRWVYTGTSPHPTVTRDQIWFSRKVLPEFRSEIDLLPDFVLNNPRVENLGLVRHCTAIRDLGTKAAAIQERMAFDARRLACST